MYPIVLEFAGFGDIARVENGRGLTSPLTSGFRKPLNFFM